MNCNNCMGRCCDPVTISISPQQITEGYVNSKTGYRKVTDAKEIEKMYKNLVFKGISRYSSAEAGEYKEGQHTFMYECKQFDYETRKCKDYENRMTFCKDYGETNDCGYTNCNDKS